MARLLLENDKDYDRELLPMSELNEAATVNQSNTQLSDTEAIKSPDVNQSDEEKLNLDAGIDYTLAEVLGIKGFELQYDNYKIVDSYPEDSSVEYFSVTPRTGDQLAVVSFRLKNTTKKKKEIDMTKAGIKYQMDINVGTIYEPSFTVLENDLKYLKTTLKSGEEKSVVLLFEIDKELKLNDINLMVSSDNKAKIIVMK